MSAPGDGAAETVRLTIDGRDVEVPRGTTLLEAARRLGISVPTLCHVPGLEPAASCFLCCVQVAGYRTLSPSCAMPVAEGMEVETRSEDVVASRTMALELLLSDHAGDCVAPCAVQCPAELDIPGFLYEIANGDGDRAMEVISRTLSLPGALGRICPRLCEESCRRCDHDEGLAIGALHRFAADEQSRRPSASGVRRGRPTGKSVGIIGAGPAGLTAAFYLQQRGHDCRLYDRHAKAGGMLRYGVPAYRLPREALDDEIAVIEGLGATFEMGVEWGQDFTLAELRERHDAVFVGIGAQGARGLGCEGEELALLGLDLLRRVAEGDRPRLGRRVAVVGGGNTAMDAARTAVRLGAQVTVLYRRSKREMPCLLEEVDGAELEGVEMRYLVAPTRLAQNGDGFELTCREMVLGPEDSSGRRRPEPVPGSDYTVGFDTVVAAVGQTVALSLARDQGLETTGWGIAVDEKTLRTNLSGVFAGGDAVLGADLAVRAVAAGRAAAESIDQLLTGAEVTGPTGWTDILMQPVDEAERATLFRGIEASTRVRGEELDLPQRLAGFDEIEAGLRPEQADREARRCMTCGCRKADGCQLRQWATEYDVDPYRFRGRRRRFDEDTSHPEIVYEPGKCIVCDACVRIAADAGEEVGVAIVGRGFEVSMAVPLDQPLSIGLRNAARRAAEACPTGALALKTARACQLGGCSSSTTETVVEIGGHRLHDRRSS